VSSSNAARDDESPARHASVRDARGLRRSGLELIGDVAWGTHFCQFYETKQDLRVLFPEETRRESLAKIGRALSGEYYASVEMPILRKDGGVRVALWSSANVYADDGVTLVGTIAQGQDITEGNYAEEALRAANQELQGQSEEFAQLNEELRVTNDELQREIIERERASAELDSVVVDFREAYFIDTAILAYLAQSAKMLRHRGKRLRVIVRKGSHPERVLNLSSFGQLMEIDSEPEETGG